jgi:hypothetical protein
VLFPQLKGKCQGKTRKDGARTALNFVWLLFVLFYVVFVCKCVLPPGDNPIAVNKYILIYKFLQEPWLQKQTYAGSKGNEQTRVFKKIYSFSLKDYPTTCADV